MNKIKKKVRFFLRSNASIVGAITLTNLLLLNMLQCEELEVRVVPSQEDISEIAQLEKILRERHC